MSKYCSDAALSLATLKGGDNLPPLHKSPTEVDVVRFCAAIRNFHRFHYDQAFMEAKGQGKIIIPGFMLGHWCIEAATRGISQAVTVTGLKFRNTRMAPIGGRYEVRGAVESCNTQDLSCTLDVMDLQDGASVTHATVRLSIPA